MVPNQLIAGGDAGEEDEPVQDEAEEEEGAVKNFKVINYWLF